MELSRIFLYEPECAELYIDGIVISGNKDYPDLSVKNVIEHAYTYPRRADVLQSRFGAKIFEDAGYLTELVTRPLLSLCRDLAHNAFNHTIGKFYMCFDNMMLTLFSLDSRPETIYYGCNRAVDNLFEIITRLSSQLGKPISEVYFFTKGKCERANIRKNRDGEYTLVIY